MSTGGWIFSILGMVIVVALLIAAAVWLVSVLGTRRGGAASAASAREILDRRLAGGEVTVAQYEQLRETVGDGPAATTVEARPGRPARVVG